MAFDEYTKMTVPQLHKAAKEMGLDLNAKTPRAEILDAIKAHEAASQQSPSQGTAPSPEPTVSPDGVSSQDTGDGAKSNTPPEKAPDSDDAASALSGADPDEGDDDAAGATQNTPPGSAPRADGQEPHPSGANPVESAADAPHPYEVLGRIKVGGTIHAPSDAPDKPVTVTLTPADAAEAVAAGVLKPIPQPTQET